MNTMPDAIWANEFLELASDKYEPNGSDVPSAYIHKYVREDLVKANADQLEQMKSDMRIAAGEYSIPVPEPGSDMARILSANIILKSHLKDASNMEAYYKEVNHDLVGENTQLKYEIEQLKAELGYERL